MICRTCAQAEDCAEEETTKGHHIRSRCCGVAGSKRLMEWNAKNNKADGTQEMRVYIHAFGVEVGQTVKGGVDGIGGRAVMSMYELIVLLPWVEFIPVKEVSFGLGDIGWTAA